MKITIAALFAVLIAATIAQAEPDVAGSSDAGFAAAAPIVTGEFGPKGWSFNPLGVANYERSEWAKSWGFGQVITIPVDLTIHAVKEAPFQWAAIAAGAVFITDTWGARTQLKKLFGGESGSDGEDDGTDDTTASGKLPTVSQTGNGVVIIASGTGNTINYAPATTETTTTAAKRDPSAQTFRGNGFRMQLVTE